MIPATIASLHYLALALGFWGLVERGSAFKAMRETQVTRELLKKAFLSDTIWGIAAILWIATGLYRAFGNLEKAAPFYVANKAFHIKMGLFALVFICEAVPMTLLIKWRLAVRRGQIPQISQTTLKRLRMINHTEKTLLVLMIFAASVMARGLWMIGR